jgi:hypothetical protein
MAGSEGGIVYRFSVDIELLTERCAARIGGELSCWDRVLVFATLAKICCGGTVMDSLTVVGLGLVLSRSIMEQHGGRIWAESTPGRGSRFLFTLPAAGTTAT